jgi:MerR family mercuric resistance operon transcriptional regulator
MDDIRPQLAIGELSRRTGCNIETIRYYERIRILPRPARTAGGHRLYTLHQVKRLWFVRRARELGFSLEEVRALLALADQRHTRCADVRDMAAGHRADVRAKIADLKRMERVLNAMIARCADGTLPDCPIIEVLFREPE